MSIAAQRENYAQGRITIEQFAKRIEPDLLREMPHGAATPEGWDPLPPCDHDWIDVTQLGALRLELCALCGEQR